MVFRSNEKKERRLEAFLEPLREARQEWERVASLPGTQSGLEVASEEPIRTHSK